MFNLTITDRCLTLIFYIFLGLALFALGIQFYEKIFSNRQNIDLTTPFNFIFWAFFAKYNYAIQYFLKKIALINNEERNRQLTTGEIQKNKYLFF